MAYPKTYTAWRRTSGTSPLTLEKSTETLPAELQPQEVLIKIHAVSLNYRDVAMLNGKYPIHIVDRGVPASDCAAAVVETGSGVTAFKAGDKVSVIFDLNNLTGTELVTRTLGGDVEGVLREYAIYDQNDLVLLPAHLSWEEDATISCAGVTAWDALSMPESAHKGKTALLQGTGGVTLFSLLICLAAGIRPIITSSSDAKLEAIAKLASKGKEILTINYKTHPKWEEEVRRLTGGKGVDIVVETVGKATVAQSLASIGRRGEVSLVGFLGGFRADLTPDITMTILGLSATVRGITVGSKIQHEALCKFLEDEQVSLKPVLDKTFSFDDSVAAFDYLYSGQHAGKVIIKL